MENFFNLYSHGFVRVAVCVPRLRVADAPFNAEETVTLARRAAEAHAVLAVFPELGLTAYSNEDLFHQEALLAAAKEALAYVVAASEGMRTTLIVGVPLRVDHRLFNCACVVSRGRILGVAVKSYLPNYREFYERRQFCPAEEVSSATVDLCGQRGIPFGGDLIFAAENIPHFAFFVEICEDLWVPVPPSSFAAMAGATVIANLSASNVTIAKSD